MIGNVFDSTKESSLRNEVFSIRNIIIKAIKIPLKQPKRLPKIKFKEPSKGKVVTNSEFKKIQGDKMNEMRERYNRGGGNRGGWGNSRARLN